MLRVLESASRFIPSASSHWLFLSTSSYEHDFVTVFITFAIHPSHIHFITQCAKLAYFVNLLPSSFCTDNSLQKMSAGVTISAVINDILLLALYSVDIRCFVAGHLFFSFIHPSIHPRVKNEENTIIWTAHPPHT